MLQVVIDGSMFGIEKGGGFHDVLFPGWMGALLFTCSIHFVSMF